MIQIKALKQGVVALLSQRKIILSLALVDFKEQFSGSYFGVLWAVIRPLIFVSVIWFIFSIGIKGELLDEKVPFILYLLTGYVPWMFFSTGLNNLMKSFSGHKNLVKRPAFNKINLPAAGIISTIIMHGVFLAILFSVLILKGFYPTIYWLQVFYYVAMASVFLFGIGLVLASLRVFTKDIAQLVGALLQVGFWLTPIFWSISHVPQKYLWVLNLNPMVYIVNGYRNTFIYDVWFWQDTSFLITYLAYTLTSLTVGLVVYKKLKPHFGDVL